MDLESESIPFGEFNLLRRIAVGGMAEVFLAERRGPGGFRKLFALKSIHTHLCVDPDIVAMFYDEARIAGALTHPCIAQVYELGEVERRPYLAEEFVYGKNLRAITRARDGWPLTEALAIARDVALALDAAHRACDDDGRHLEVVHRDVSPKNVLVSFAGAVKLIDFGVAKAAQRSTETQGGVRKGKLAYMSPEQIKGEAVDGRSDLFALGVVLYEMAVGARPFDGEPGAELALRIAEEPHAPVPDFVAADVATVIERALAKVPGERFADGREMAAALEHLLLERSTMPNMAAREEMMHRLFAEEVSAGPLRAGEPVIPTLPLPIDRSGTPITGATAWREPEGG